MYRKLIVGVNFDVMTERAVSAALQLAQGTDGAVVLLHVLPEGTNMQEPSGQVAEYRLAIEQRLRDRAKELSVTSGVHVDWGVVNGAAADEIVKYVQLWGGDAIVLGTESRSGLGRILIGSVAERVIKLSTVPVVVVGPQTVVPPVSLPPPAATK